MSMQNSMVRETSVGTRRQVTPYQRHGRSTLVIEYEAVEVAENDLNIGDWRKLLAEANAGILLPPAMKAVKDRAERYAQQQLAHNALVDVNTLSQHRLAWNIVADEQAAEYAADQLDRRALMNQPF